MARTPSALNRQTRGAAQNRVTSAPRARRRGVKRATGSDRPGPVPETAGCACRRAARPATPAKEPPGPLGTAVIPDAARIERKTLRVPPKRQKSCRHRVTRELIGWVPSKRRETGPRPRPIRLGLREPGRRRSRCSGAEKTGSCARAGLTDSSWPASDECEPGRHLVWARAPGAAPALRNSLRYTGSSCPRSGSLHPSLDVGFEPQPWVSSLVPEVR